MNVEIAKDLLEMKGATVDVARDGLEAISAFEKSKPEEYDVILMDIMMPNMDGITAKTNELTIKSFDFEIITL